MKSKHWLWAFAALPLVCVPLIAQEIAKDAPPAQDAKVAQDAKPAPAAPETPEAASTDKPDPPEERISADNNTSFPVDI